MKKKVFISQPMKGKSDDEIAADRAVLVGRVKEMYGDVEVIDSFFRGAPVDAKPLWFLAESLRLLSTADVVVFAPEWERARGCRIEHLCAEEYGIQISDC